MSIEITKLLHDSAYEMIRNRGIDRVKEAIYDGKIKLRALINETECYKEFLSYPIARIIISATRNKYCINRYAHAEGLRALEYMERESAESIVRIANELNIDCIYHGEEFSVHFSDFLKYTDGLYSELVWQLPDRNLFVAGYI
jgi:DNA primase large subunit